MTKKRAIVLIGLAVVFLALYLIYQYAPTLFLSPQKKPGETSRAPYEYYIIIEEETGKILAYVSSVVVTEGDEYIAEDNTRYVVTKVIENKAYAQVAGTARKKSWKPEFRKSDWF